ncbi:zinc finger and BTB domain-containing protein 22 [Callorhinchus milii]|uniref:Zinc finger and BTB domain containing 22 n=1 Tax=Callorhinchus milii TaxID=7868 RepID=A0A4W3GPM3_CALMI|nr:zinc finger and BTB domain-containing protein 22 [Callorhinchus milii]|eukprot:gi/632987578/ref/XP_007882633.1/ PREDICTED: zinc finger and BTB domain-containing protein 22 [Callorhinchus milii]
MLYVDFPNFGNSLLESLNRQRAEGKFCDISIQVQGRVFKAHRAVLAASSPYFHDQVLFRNASRIVLPGAMDPGAFESVLTSSYTGRLAVPPADIVSFLTVGSFLQMWHIVDKCTELLREGLPPSTGPGPRGARATENQSPSSSSNNYFSPREAARPRPREAKSEGSEEEEETGFVKDRDGGAVTGSDYQPLGAGEAEPARGGEEEEEEEEGESSSRSPDSLYPRLPLAQPPPLGRWVYVKKERPEEDLVLTCEEDGQHFLKGPRVGGEEGLRQLSIAGVRTLAGGAGGSDEQPDYFYGSSEELGYEGGLDESPRGGGAYPLPLLLQAGGGMGVPGAGGDLRHGPVQPPAGTGAPKAFACHCGKTFTHKSQRDRHVNMHLNLRPFGCSACGKKFKMKHHLVEHMKIHTGHKPFGCHVCGKKFMWRDSFLRHRAACEKLQRATSGNLEPPPN